MQVKGGPATHLGIELLFKLLPADGPEKTTGT